MPRKTPDSAATEEADLKALLYRKVEIPEDWKELGACWASEKLIFFGPDKEEMEEAAAICHASCSIRLPCLQSSLGIDSPRDVQKDGVWGGYLPEQRVIIRRKFLDRRVRMRLEEQRVKV